MAQPFWVFSLCVAFCAATLWAEEPGPAETDEQAYARHMKEGKEAKHSQDVREHYAKAVTIARRLGTTDPRLVEALYQLAQFTVEFKDREAAFREILSIREQAKPSDPILITQAILDLCTQLRFQSQVEDALPDLKRADALMENQSGQEAARLHWRVLEEMARNREEALKPGEIEPLLPRMLRLAEERIGKFSVEAAETHLWLAFQFKRTGETEKAISHFRAAAVAYEGAEGKTSAKYAMSEERLGEYLWQTEKLDEAIQAYRRAKDAFEAAFGPGDLNLARCYNHIGRFLSDQGLYSDSEVQYRAAWEIVQRRLGEDDLGMGQCASYLGNVLRYQGKNEDALPLLQRALKIAETNQDPDYPTIGDRACDLGRALLELNRFDEAERNYKRALEAYKKRLVDFSVQGQVTHAHLARVKVWRGQGAEVEAELRTLAEDWELHELPKDEWFIEVLEPLAWACGQAGKHTDAAGFHERVAQLSAEVYGKDHASVARCNNRASTSWRDAGRPEKAQEAARRALAIVEKWGEKESLILADAHFSLGAACFEAHQLKEARTSLERALTLHRKIHPAHAPEIGYDLQYLGCVYEQESRFSEAATRYEEALACFEKHPNTYEHPYLRTMANLAGVALRAGDSPKAWTYNQRLLDHPNFHRPDYLAIRAESFARQATLLYYKFDHEAALALGLKALPMLLAERPQRHNHISALLSTLARASWHSGKVADAQLYYTRALNLNRTHFQGYWEEFMLEGELGAVDRALGKAERGRGRIEGVLPKLEKLLGANDPGIAILRAELGAAYLDLGRTDEAILHLSQAVQTMEAIFEKDHPVLRRDGTRLAGALRKANKEADARRLEIKLGLVEAVPKPEP